MTRPAPKPLTPAQQALALTCERLAYQTAHHWCIPRGCTRDEAVSEALHALVDAARNFRPELGFRFSTYAATSIRRRLGGWVQDELRHQTRQEPTPSVPEDIWHPTDPAPPVEDTVSLADEADHIWSSLSGLSSRDRQVLRLRFDEGLSYPEMARRLRRSKQRCAQMVNGALARARRVMAC